RQSAGFPEQVMPHLVEALTAEHRAAIVFGSEPTGLSNETISRCHYLIEIPADMSYPVLNLAQAVAVCLYSLRVEWLKTTGETIERSADREAPAEFAAQERMFDQLRGALEKIHFLYGDKAKPLMHALRHLIGKARPSAMELKLLQGLARQIRWYVAEHS